MLERRQGHCPDCTHDVIDARDLKWYRNVCGYHFGPENDPHARRGLLPIVRAGRAELLVFSVLFALLGAAACLLGAYVHSLFFLVLVPVVLLWGFVVSFFRDPERVVPEDPAAVVSPADGTVTHVEEVDEADFPGGRALRVSIFLSVFNVHVNRNPRPGRVTSVRYFPGEFLDARAGECAVRNEQFWTDYEDGTTGTPVRVKQIAGAIARRIVCWLRPGEEVRAGARFGMIKFGSRTDLLLPVGAGEVRVKVGDKVRGGSSVLLRVSAK
jgi:phosphatidylserine decarboxylase